MGKRDGDEWDTIFSKHAETRPIYDEWLDKHADRLERASGRPILDLGCGLGADTLYLTERGYEVFACDLSETALAAVRTFAPQVRTVRLDLSEPLPFADGFARVAVADLSLHYFDWTTSRAVLREIARVLGPDGTLLLRVNSVDDVNHGAMQGVLLEPYYYEVHGNHKRFFDRGLLLELLEGWKVEYMAEADMHRYSLPKKLWEAAVVVEQPRDGAASEVRSIKEHA